MTHNRCDCYYRDNTFSSDVHKYPVLIFTQPFRNSEVGAPFWCLQWWLLPRFHSSIQKDVIEVIRQWWFSANMLSVVFSLLGFYFSGNLLLERIIRSFWIVIHPAKPLEQKVWKYVLLGSFYFSRHSQPQHTHTNTPEEPTYVMN